MSSRAEPVTLTLPGGSLPDVMSLSATLLDRMHHLLECNTEGQLSAIEREELETLVHMAQFGQIITSALRSSGTP
jgi:hypothetical protein